MDIDFDFKLYALGLEACIAMPHRPSCAATSLCIRMYPSSPHCVPHEFFTSQYLVLSLLTPYPTAVTSWSRLVPQAPVKTPLE